MARTAANEREIISGILLPQECSTYKSRLRPSQSTPAAVSLTTRDPRSYSRRTVPTFTGDAAWRLRMKCPRCQAEHDAGARFCEDCGARLEAACPSCGIPVTPGKKFCRACGAALTTEPAGRFASPE